MRGCFCIIEVNDYCHLIVAGAVLGELYQCTSLAFAQARSRKDQKSQAKLLYNSRQVYVPALQAPACRKRPPASA